MYIYSAFHILITKTRARLKAELRNKEQQPCTEQPLVCCSTSFTYITYTHSLSWCCFSADLRAVVLSCPCMKETRSMTEKLILEQQRRRRDGTNHSVLGGVKNTEGGSFCNTKNPVVAAPHIKGDLCFKAYEV